MAGHVTGETGSDCTGMRRVRGMERMRGERRPSPPHDTLPLVLVQFLMLLPANVLLWSQVAATVLHFEYSREGSAWIPPPVVGSVGGEGSVQEPISDAFSGCRDLFRETGRSYARCVGGMKLW